MQFKHSYKLSTHLTFWTTVIVLTLATVLSVGIGIYSTRLIQENVKSELAETALHMADKMDQFMWSRSGELYTIASLPQFKTLDEPLELEALINTLRDNFPSFSWIGVTDSSGIVIASTDGILRSVDISERPVFINGIQGKFIGDVHEAVLLQDFLPNPTGETMKFVDISYPLSDANGNVIGVIAAHLSWEWAHEVQDTILTPLKIQSGTEMYVVSAIDQTILLGPQNRIGTKFVPDKNGYIETSTVADGYLDYRGLDWQIFVRQTERQAFQNIRELQFIIWCLGAAFAVLFIFIGRATSKAVAKPIVELTKTLDQVRFGEAPVFDHSKGIAEIDQLTETIYELFETLNINVQTIGNLEVAVNTDPLTGLANRSGLKDYWDKITRHQKLLTMLALDLDGFKLINDTYGHDAGDFVLKEVATRLKSAVRDRELVARIGGDEFVVVLISNDPGIDAGNLVSKRIIESVNKPIYYHAFTLTVGCSVGGATWQGDQTLAEILSESDSNLYKAKAGGKNKFESD